MRAGLTARLTPHFLLQSGEGHRGERKSKGVREAAARHGALEALEVEIDAEARRVRDRDAPLSHPVPPGVEPWHRRLVPLDVGEALDGAEQGRAQLPKPWAKPKSEQCLGFTLDEFARLDLSRMDFSEVYAEFTDAARLPDELQTSELIQQKIRDYYERSNP